MVLNQHELTVFRGGQFQPFYPGQFRPVFGGQFQPLKVVSLIWSTMVNFTGISTYGSKDVWEGDLGLLNAGIKYKINKVK
jgi:hypothetical protein